ncbi:uncharacterized protein LOC142639797 [Castanea sativa]|uniref:uncharacterized protein LOC142639797 n=1 Tax=Castanea sativa TaxID=21020 RepID=UPI003F6524A1
MGTRNCNIIHAIWECGIAQDVWVGCAISLQKCIFGFHDVVALFEYLMDRLSTSEFEVFLVHAWLLWNQRNVVAHGGQIRDPKLLNQRAVEYLVIKINKNSHGEVMAAMFVKGPSVSSSEEAEALACRKALDFVVEAGFSELIVEGDNSAVMKVVAGSSGGYSLLGHVYEDIHCNLRGLHSVSISCIRREGNRVAHILAQYARNVTNELYWMEEAPPAVLEALCHDCFNINE